MKEQVYVQDQLSIMNNCIACLKGEERCTDCQEDFDNRQTNLAHEIVDEGNLQYRKPWMQSPDDISGHDWIAPLTRINGRERLEFMEPVVHMIDRYFEPQLELDSFEMVCDGCKYVCNKYAPCPNCETVRHG